MSEAELIAAKAQVGRLDAALAAALNMIDGDGLPPDWDYLRLVRSQLPKIGESVEKLAHQIHELKRTRSEAEAAARVAGYQEGQQDLRRSFNALLRP